jgi:hypothetical protein
MNNYTETKKAIDDIRRKYTSAWDVIFRAAIGYMIECGQETLKDTEWFNKQIQHIDESHNKAEAENKILLVGRDVEKGVCECARELAEFESNDILMYMQREIWLSAEFGDLSYQRAISLLQSTINYALIFTETDSVKDELHDIGFEDEELCALGYEDVFFKEEE